MQKKGRRVSLDHLFEKSSDDVKRVTRTSRWGNPYKITGDITREKSIELYEEYLQSKLNTDPNFLNPLQGKYLACFCDIDLKCHVDVILKYMDE